MKKPDAHRSPITGETITASTEWIAEGQRFRVEYDDTEARHCVRGAEGWSVIESTPRYPDGKFDLTRVGDEFRRTFRALFAQVVRDTMGPHPHRFEIEAPIWRLVSSWR